MYWCPRRLRFEAQHLMHALSRNNVRKWVALSEGAGGTVGWLTVSRAPCPNTFPTLTIASFVRWQTNERKEVSCSTATCIVLGIP